LPPPAKPSGLDCVDDRLLPLERHDDSVRVTAPPAAGHASTRRCERPAHPASV
jgi:hypothetical protein